MFRVHVFIHNAEQRHGRKRIIIRRTMTAVNISMNDEIVSVWENKRQRIELMVNVAERHLFACFAIRDHHATCLSQAPGK